MHCGGGPATQAVWEQAAATTRDSEGGREYYTKEYLFTEVMPRFHPRLGMYMRAMDVLHRIEGYGMGR